MPDESDPRPRVEDLPWIYHSEPPGWLINAYATIADAGVVITRLDIRPDPQVDTPLGITATLLDSIKLPALRSDIASQIERAATDTAAAIAEVGSESPVFELLNRMYEKATGETKAARDAEPKRAALRKQRTWVAQAEEVLEAADAARDSGTELNQILSVLWLMEPEGVKSRVRRLKERNYIAGRGNSLVPGTALTIWRDRQKDEPEEE